MQNEGTDLNLRAGEWVEVRSKEEILASLDQNGQLDSMPFMPEMLRFCGQRFPVFKRAHKTCDPVNGLGARGMRSAVHLSGLRCDGSAHDGCQAGCLFFWKEVWLKRVSAPNAAEARGPNAEGGCTEADLYRTTVQAETGPQTERTYICQATCVWDATYPLKPWDIRHYVEDVTSGNVRVSQIFAALIFTLYQNIAEAGLGIGSFMRWAYDRFQKFRGGTPYPVRVGRVPRGQKTPTLSLGLQPGEMVRMKSYPQILETLDEDARNRGLYFDGEMAPFCNGTFRVLRRVERIIHEKTGKMLQFKNAAVILEGVECLARYVKYRKFCPRSYYQYAREIWLERTVAPPHSPAAPESPAPPAQ